MRIQVRARLEDFGKAALQTQIEDALRDSLTRFQRQVESVQFFLRDLNGPKGGLDKAATCVVNLKGLSPIIIRDSGASLLALLNRISSRAGHSVSRKIGKQRKQRIANRTRISDLEVLFPVESLVASD